MAWLGIDPGLDGAVALIQPDGAVRIWDTPSLEAEAKRKTKSGKHAVRTTYDYAGMASIVSAARIVAADGFTAPVVLELVNAMPKQGVASTFKFGDGFGAWKGILAALLIPYELVHPRRWTNRLLADLPRQDGASVIKAGQLYPAIASELRTPRGRVLHGRADAILLAHYARLSVG